MRIGIDRQSIIDKNDRIVLEGIHRGYDFAQEIDRLITAKLTEVPLSNHFFWRAAIRTISSTCGLLGKMIKNDANEQRLIDVMEQTTMEKTEDNP